jgi:hypothetical protein
MEIIEGEILEFKKAEPEPKRLQPDKVNAVMLNDVQASLTAFQATGLVIFLQQADVALQKLLKVGGV